MVIHRPQVDSPKKKPAMQGLNAFFDVSVNKMFNKQCSCWWVEIPSCPYDMHRQLPRGSILVYKRDWWGQHGAHLGPTGPRWAPCWLHEPCYRGHHLSVGNNNIFCAHNVISIPTDALAPCVTQEISSPSFSSPLIICLGNGLAPNKWEPIALVNDGIWITYIYIIGKQCVKLVWYITGEFSFPMFGLNSLIKEN